MPKLEFTKAEVSLLKEILETDRSDLRMEISSTDLKNLRELHEKEKAIKRLIERLGSK
jgi:hypothetical protein